MQQWMNYKWTLAILGLIPIATANAELIIQENSTTNTTSFAVPAVNHETAFTACLNRLKPQAVAAGASSALYTSYTQNLRPDRSVLERLNYQPEFSTPIWDYLSGLVDQERVDLGRQKITEHRTVLEKISQHYGLPIETIVAVWGVESNYGSIAGRYPLLQALGTLSCEGRRQSFFRGEFFSAMRILQRGDVTQNELVGSWAGAFGQTQFMPTTYEELAVDFDGDGRRNLVSSTTDALASTANFLNKRGWRTGQPWGYEVRVPDQVSIAGESRTQKRPLSYWINQGLRRVDGQPLLSPGLMEDSRAGLLAPAGENGPLFLVFHNFDVLYRYNAAESYALAIAHLSDRLVGKGGFNTAWPTPDAGTSRAERREIQQYLLKRGYDIGAVDGLIGDKSRQAIRQEQLRLGLTPNARAGQVFLRTIRQASVQ